MRLFLPRGSRHTLFASGQVPAQYRRHIIPGAVSLYTPGSFGAFLLQEIKGNGSIFHLDHFFIEKRAYLLASTDDPLIILVFLLEGNIRCRLAGSGDLLLEENRYYLFYVPPQLNHSIWFEPGNYVSFQVYLSPDFLQNLGPAYPIMQDLLQRFRHGSSKGISHYAAPIRRKVKTLIEEILYCPMEERGRSLYCGSRILELLRLYVKGMDIDSPEPPPLSRYMQAIYTAKEFIQNNLDQPLTISRLAERVLISEVTLKKWFKKLVGMPIHHYVREQRMKKARQLLLETDLTIGEIAEGTGFKDPSHFAKVFKQFYGQLPLEYRNG